MKEEDTVEQLEPINLLNAGEWETAVNVLLWLIVCRADHARDASVLFQVASFLRLSVYRFSEHPSSRVVVQPHVGFVIFALFFYSYIHHSFFSAIDAHIVGVGACPQRCRRSVQTKQVEHTTYFQSFTPICIQSTV